MFSMLSRNGRTNDSGKLHARLDIPISEEMLEQVIVAAAEKGMPKAEFARSLLAQAMAAPHTIGLSERAASMLTVLSSLHGMEQQEYALRLLEAALSSEYNMIQRLARERAPAPVEVSGSFVG